MILDLTTAHLATISQMALSIETCETNNNHTVSYSLFAPKRESALGTSRDQAMTLDSDHEPGRECPCHVPAGSTSTRNRESTFQGFLYLHTSFLLSVVLILSLSLAALYPSVLFAVP